MSSTPTPPHSRTPTPVVPAAGASRRMGRRNKLLLPFRGKPLAAHVVEAARAATGSAIIVVTGHERARVERALDSYDVRFVHNADYCDGMASSLRCGVAAASDEATSEAASGFLVCLGDMPRVSVEALRLLCDRFREAPTGSIITFGGAPGPPIVFDQRHRDALLHLDGDTGAKPLLRRHADAVIRVPPADADLSAEALSADIDTPDAFRRLTTEQYELGATSG